MFQLEYYVLGEGNPSLGGIDFGGIPSTTEQTDTIDVTGTEGQAETVTALRAAATLSISTAGTYTFFVTSVGDADLLINGSAATSTVYGQNGPRLEVFTVELDAGEHSLDVRGLQNTDAPKLQLDWAGPDSGGERTALTSDALADLGLGDGTAQTDQTNDNDQADEQDTAGVDATAPDATAEQDNQTIPAGAVGPCPKTGDPICLCDSESNSENDEDTAHDHDGHDHGAGAGLPQPTTPEEIEAFVAAVKAETDDTGHNAHSDDSGKAVEHAELLDLVPRSEATHVAISDGDWSDPSTWYEGRIPDADAKVLIPKGVAVRYDTESDESLFTVRIDGELSFATDINTKLLLDTMVVSDTGRLEIGTEENPVEAGVSADIVIANNGDIDVGWDGTLLSRGVLSHGEVEIHGQEKTEFLKVSDAPMAGDTEISLSEIPEGWAVGDTIVLTGTHKQGWRWSTEEGAMTYFESEDEEVTITAIDGNTITIDRPLEHDHDTPRDDLFAYVANMTRSVTFSSEDGDQTEIHHRGHVMFMHSDDVDVRYAAFDDLGRTDKSVPAFDVENVDTITAETNVKGRYAMHFHKTGVSVDEDPALAIGNTVSGSPGWGFVHHSSHADFVGNVAFDVFGAAFAAEDGDETGIWSNNLAIRSQGIGTGDAIVKSPDDVPRDDNGRTGDGFFFAGRMVEADNNVAANTNNGFVWMSRGPRTDVDTDNLLQPEIAHGASTLDGDVPVIQDFNNNEAFGTHSGIIVIKIGPHQNHDVRTVMDGFLNWETAQGAHLTYTGHYTVKDFDLIATQSDIKFNDPEVGLYFGKNSIDIVANGLKVDGFATGVKFDGASQNIPDSDFGHVLIDAELTNNDQDLLGYNPARHSFISSDDLVEGRLAFDWQGDNLIGGQEHVYLNGIKTDSIGSRERSTQLDEHVIKFWDFAALVKANGYYSTTDGRQVFIVEDYIADRATGELEKIGLIVELDGTAAKVANRYDSPPIGVIDLNSPAANASDDSASTKLNQAVVIDVLANDSNSENIWVDGITSPKNGDVTLQDDGTILYTPHHGKSGTDSFSYWVTNGNAKFTKATVTLNVSSEPGEDTGAGDDQTTGETGGDVADDGSQGDTGSETGGDDTTVGGTGDDTVNDDSGSETGGGDDTSTGSTGDDIVPDPTTGGAEADQLVIGENDGIIYALDGHDLVTGSAAANEVYGGAGQDTIMGAAGNDNLSGGADADLLDGEEGEDQLFGHDGNDTLRGGANDDNLRGGTGLDQLFGGTGNDFLSGGGGGDTLVGDSGKDTLYGNYGDDFLWGGNGKDMLKGGAGKDVLLGEIGRDSLYGSGGKDTLSGGQDDDLLHGGGGRDALYGDDGNDSLFGDYGADLLWGGNGNDLLSGDYGADTLAGSAGQDTLDGGAGNDILTGGKGADRFFIQAGDGHDRIEDFQADDVLELDGFLLVGKGLTESAWENADGDLTISNANDSITFTGLTLDDLDWITIA